jgi:hypothetical protein
MFVLFPGCFPLLCKLPAFFLLCKLPVHLRLVVCVALCDICYMNTSLNVASTSDSNHQSSLPADS